MNKSRNYKIDNIKGILMILVVLGHLYELAEFPGSRFQYLLIYTFHMPLFAFVSGWCFKPAKDNKLFKNIVYPYLVFQTLALTVIPAYSGTPLSEMELQYTTPYWVMWYLLSLCFWHLLMNVIQMKKHGWIVLGISFVIAILAGFENSVGYYLSLSRTLVFFPFFVAGVCMSRRSLLNLKALNSSRTIKIGVRVVSLLAAIACALLVYYFQDQLYPSWLFGSYSYQAAEYTWMVRVFNFVIALVFIALFVLWIPNVQIPILSTIGINSIYVYLLHMFVVKYPGFRTFVNTLPMPAASVPVLAILIAVLFSLPWIALIFRPLVKWPFDFKRQKKSDVKA